MADSTIPALMGQLAPQLAARSLVVEDVTIVPAGSRRVVRVLVDRDLRDLDPSDTGSPVVPLSLDEVADASRVVNDVLDRSDLLGERPYTLEVSSPGVGRALTGYAGLRRNVGRLVDLHRTGVGPLTGRVLGVSADEVVLELPAAGKRAAGQVTVPLSEVESARVQVEFSRPGPTSDELGEDD